MRSIFSSNISFQDAARKAQSAGFTITGQAQNPKTGLFIVFAQRNNNQQQRSALDGGWLRGKI